eukprot:3394067-Amphidinium_carterae.1
MQVGKKCDGAKIKVQDKLRCFHAQYGCLVLRTKKSEITVICIYKHVGVSNGMNQTQITTDGCNGQVMISSATVELGTGGSRRSSAMDSWSLAWVPQPTECRERPETTGF